MLHPIIQMSLKTLHKPVTNHTVTPVAAAFTESMMVTTSCIGHSRIFCIRTSMDIIPRLSTHVVSCISAAALQ